MILKREVEEYLCYCHLQKGLDEKTVKAYQNDLKQFLEFAEQKDEPLSKQALGEYIIELQQKYLRRSLFAFDSAGLWYVLPEGFAGEDPQNQMHKEKRRSKRSLSQ